MTTEKLAYISTADIHPNPYQPRREFDQKTLEELAESIDHQGLIQPIIVREITIGDEKKYELVAGERRLRAVRDVLGKDRIKALVQVMTDVQSEEAALIENIQRQDLNPIEEATAIVALMKKEKLTQEQIAKRLGKSRSEISNLVRLVNLPEEVQNLVASGKLERSKGWKIAALEKVEDQLHIAKQAVEKGWNLDKIRKEADRLINPQIVEETQVEQPQPRRMKATVSVAEQTKNLVLVEFDDDEALKEFLAYMIENEFKCFTGETILIELKSRATMKRSDPIPDIFDEVEKEVNETTAEMEESE